MPLNKVVLRMMLWSLGLAAASGVLAALFGGGETVWRVVGTGFVTAFACAALLPFSVQIDREETRVAGLVGMAVVLIEYNLALVLIWKVAQILFGRDWQQPLGKTMLFFGMASALLALSYMLAGEPHSRLAGSVGAGATILTFTAYMIAIWVPEPFLDAEKWWESGSALFLLGMLVLASLVGAGGPPRRTWRWVAVPAASMAFVLWMAGVWLGTRSAWGTVLFSALMAVTVVIGHASLSLLVKLSNGQRWVRAGTIVAIVLTAAAIVLVIAGQEYGDHAWGEGLLGRFVTAAGIAASCGSVTLIVLARMNRGVGGESSAVQLKRMTIVCPRCGKEQSIEIGESACAACKLSISVRVEESRPGGAIPGLV
jgi:ribosomal protein L37E